MTEAKPARRSKKPLHFPTARLAPRNNSFVRHDAAMSGRLFFGTLLTVMLCGVLPTAAQTFLLDGYHNCQRATNGKPYCQRPTSGETYFPVSEQFFSRYTSAREAAASRPQTVIQNNTVNNTAIVQRLENEASDLRGMMALYRDIIREQSQQNATVSACHGVAAETRAVLTNRLREVETGFRERTTQLSGYVTSIRPNDPDLKITARRASELFPKIPFYIPATPETGEFWLEPNVTDTGELAFNLKFIDTGAGIDKVRSTIPLNVRELETVRDALCKLTDWATVAHKNRVTNFSKRASCFPEARCPEEGGKRDGVSSTEIIFAVQEDGRTSGRIQRNRGRFTDGYNMSMESVLLLQAYLNHVLLEGKQEFDAGTRTREEVRDLFK